MANPLVTAWLVGGAEPDVALEAASLLLAVAYRRPTWQDEAECRLPEHSAVSWFPNRGEDPEPLLPEYEREARAAQAHGATAPGRTLGADLRQASQARAPKSADRAAKAVGTSTRAVEQAKAVAKNAPDLAEQVADGALSLDAAESTP